MCWVIFKDGEKIGILPASVTALSKGTCCFIQGIGQLGRNRGGVKSYQGDFLVEGLGMSVHTLKWQ